eukprot:gene1929-33339_t
MLPYWNVQSMCNPDPAHFLPNGSKAIWELVSKARFSPSRITVLSKYEVQVNKRWSSIPAKESPWFLTSANKRKAEVRAKLFNGEGVFVPSILCNITVHHLLSTPSYLKMHEHILCFGPVSKYVLQGLMPLEQKKALFKYLDCLGNQWNRSVKQGVDGRTAAEIMKAAFVEGITAMELAFPTWEADFNKHSIIHVAEAVQYCGPPPTLTTMVFDVCGGGLRNG